MLEAAVANMNSFGRVVVCGAISEYTENQKRVSLEILHVVYKRITIQELLAADYIKCYVEFISTTSGHFRSSKMQALCDILHGVESLPCAFVGLFRGDNIGKRLCKLLMNEKSTRIDFS
ncbi:UNVERIFIED_CONTAM: 2-alkenal reductase (NADP(+)-dependent) [Sesamum radiatum]|uniref:2-alkenal reductase (NADP(+)-dependent) n=1 Tax=Sesamum radiatum TaxID=300843 RepID=A0AAW2PLA2_SESRA